MAELVWEAVGRCIHGSTDMNLATGTACHPGLTWDQVWDLDVLEEFQRCDEPCGRSVTEGCGYCRRPMKQAGSGCVHVAP